jgi:DNA-binding transcriptional ArsR family regulator
MDADQVLNALGDGTRRGLVKILAQTPATVSDLANALGVTKTAIGQHIAILEACQLISSKKAGRVRMCKIDTRGLDVLQDWIDAQRGSWKTKFEQLGVVLSEIGTDK